VIKYSLFIFIFHICAKFQTKKKTSHDMCISMFSITLSHFERIPRNFANDGCITIFGKSSFIFSFLGLVLGPGCTFEEMAKKQTKCQ
jgi:hypothetical protein